MLTDCEYYTGSLANFQAKRWSQPSIDLSTRRKRSHKKKKKENNNSAQKGTSYQLQIFYSIKRKTNFFFSNHNFLPLPGCLFLRLFSLFSSITKSLDYFELIFELDKAFCMSSSSMSPRTSKFEARRRFVFNRLFTFWIRQQVAYKHTHQLQVT